MNDIFKIIDYIINWQQENDSEFKTLPIDEHSHLVFNHKNQIYRFIFSNKHKRDMCRLSIPRELINDYHYMIEQEDGFTFYLFTEGDYNATN